MSKDNIPTFYAQLEGEDTGVDQIALTSEPAIIVKGVMFSAQKPKLRLAAPVLIPDFKIYRVSDEMGEYNVEFTADAIDSMVKDYFSKQHTQPFNLEHNQDAPVPAYMIESWLVDNPSTDKSLTQFGIEGLKKGTWMATIQFKDEETYNKCLADGVTGFSIEAMLGLAIKANKQKQTNMNKQFKLADMTTIEGYPIFVDGDLVNGTNVFFIAPDGTKTIPDDGTLELADGQTIEIEDGKIVEIAAAGEEISDATEGEASPIEMATSGDTATSGTTSGDTTSIATEPKNSTSITAEDVTKMIDEKMAELVAKIAEMQTVIDGLSQPAPASTDKTKMSEQKFSVTERFFQFSSKN
jgi:hypothetical protein